MPTQLSVEILIAEGNYILADLEEPHLQNINIPQNGILDTRIESEKTWYSGNCKETTT